MNPKNKLGIRKDFANEMNPEPFMLEGIGVKNLDIDLFKKIKQNVSSGLDKDSFRKNARPYFEEVGFSNFFMNKDNLEITKIHENALIELYRVVLEISNEYKDYSANEATFLYYVHNLKNRLEKNRPLKHNIPIKYDFNKFIARLVSNMVFTVPYLNDLGLKGPAGIKFKDILPKLEVPKYYEYIFEEDLMEKNVHEYLEKNLELKRGYFYERELNK